MKISNLQIHDAKSWSGITTRNHLGAIGEAKPQLASKIMSKLLQRHYGTTLETMLAGIPVKTLETDDDFTWKLIGSSERNIALVEARYQGATITVSDFNVGANGAEIELVFPERLFAPTDVIVGEQNEKYPMQVQSEFREGANHVYVVKVYGADAVVSGVPGEELVAGKLFSKEFSPVSDTLSIRGGETNFTSPISFRNSFTYIRKQYICPGNMVDRKFVANFEIVDESGAKQSFTTWLQYQAFVYEHQFMQEKNRAMFYGRSTINGKGQVSNVDHHSGHAIRAGFGLREQMEVANTFFYNSFTADYLTNILLELSINKLSTDERKFVIRTGERGAILFHKAIQAEASGWNALQDTTIQKNVSSKLHSNARTFGTQYTEFMAPNGIVVRVEVDPMYDDPVRNKQMAPNNGVFSGGVAESYRMDIFDIGTVNDEPNIQKVMASNSPDINAYVPGLRDPYSPTGAAVKRVANSIDGFEMHKMCTFGAMIKDPQRTASLIPAFL
jgi:hypothetical protein